MSFRTYVEFSFTVFYDLVPLFWKVLRLEAEPCLGGNPDMGLKIAS